jgi:hypothetical protein
MPEDNRLDELLGQMPFEAAESDLVPRILTSLEETRRRAKFLSAAGWTALASASIAAASALIPRLESLLALLPSDWTASAAEWWSGLDAVPIESFKSMGLQLWSLPNAWAQSVRIELVLGGLVALLISWLLFKFILSGQISRKVVLQ